MPMVRESFGDGEAIPYLTPPGEGFAGFYTVRGDHGFGPRASFTVP